jgi:predicted DNA-binding ribbon-helix-helix protein
LAKGALPNAFTKTDLPKTVSKPHDITMIIKRSMTIHGHRTSVSLEQPFWNMLQDIAASRQQSLASLVQNIDRKRDGGLSSALRLFVLAELKKETAVVKTDTKPLDH